MTLWRSDSVSLKFTTLSPCAFIWHLPCLQSRLASLPTSCNQVSQGTVKEVSVEGDNSFSQKETLWATKVRDPSLSPSAGLCCQWVFKQNQAEMFSLNCWTYACQVLVWHSLNLLHHKEILLEGMYVCSHSIHISPAKFSSTSAPLYDYLNTIQSTSNLSCISIFACRL